MFQSNVEGVQNTELRECTDSVNIRCSLSVHGCYKLAATIYFDGFVKYSSPPQRLFQTLKSYTPAFQLQAPAGPYHSKT